jgi:hypothetical protein
MLGKAMVAMVIATAKDLPQDNILFNLWQSCLPYWINWINLKNKAHAYYLDY